MGHPKLDIPDICLTHPEDIVDEESTQQDAASADVVQMQQFHPIQ